VSVIVENKRRHDLVLSSGRVIAEGSRAVLTPEEYATVEDWVCLGWLETVGEQPDLELANAGAQVQQLRPGKQRAR
jgi:hypothetical protein